MLCVEDVLPAIWKVSSQQAGFQYNPVKFWLGYCIYVFTLATFSYYMKDLISLIKTLSSKLCKVSTPCQKEKENEGKIDVVVGIAEAKEHPDKISKFTVSGIFAINVSFYLIKQLISVDVQYKNSFHQNLFSQCHVDNC